MIFGIAGAHDTTSLPAETSARAGQLFTVETLRIVWRCVVLRCAVLCGVVRVAHDGRRNAASAAAARSGRARLLRAKGVCVSVE